MDSSKFINPLFLISSICVLVLFVSVVPMVSYAEGLPETRGFDYSESTEIVQDAQTEMTAAASSETEPESIAADELTQESEIEVSVVQDNQNGTYFEPDSSGVYLTESDGSEYMTSDYEMLLTLKSIEYQLKIIAGGVILAACAFFFWLTVYNPLKKLAVF